MVGQMTYGKKQFEHLDAEMRRLIPPFHQAMNELLHMVDADSSAFSSYMVSRLVLLRRAAVTLQGLCFCCRRR